MDTFDKLDHIAFDAITETYGHITDEQAEVLAEKIANRINSTFAVVELPEPTCSTGVNTVWIDSLNVVIIPGGRISTSGRVLTADEARRSAAVLLAAAKYAEENA